MSGRGHTGSGPSRDEWRAVDTEVLHPGSSTKGRVEVGPWRGRDLVVKDLAHQPGWVRWFTRPILRREARALQALESVAGVPRWVDHLDRDAFAMTLCAGAPLTRDMDAELQTRALRELGERVAALHATGVVHLDLRQRKNILIDASGQVSLIDFESALVLPLNRFWGRWLFGLVASLDRGAVLKFQARYRPEMLTESQRRRALRRSWVAQLWVFHRIGAVIRSIIDRTRRSRA